MRILKWIIMLAVSIGIGTFIDINIWLWGIGCLVTVIIGLILHHIFLEKDFQIV